MHDIAILTNARTVDQRSMIGYGELLLEAAAQIGYCAVELRATSLLACLTPGRVGGRPLAKLLANLDRFVISPLVLAGRRADIVHVVDPGNVLYLNVLRHGTSIVTVHDVIPYLCMAGRLQGFRPTASGKHVMRATLNRLQRVDRIVCVSENTRRDLLSLVELDPERVVTIPNAVFQPMRRACEAEAAAMRTALGLPGDGPIILHVGSNIFYKNRLAVLDVFSNIASAHPKALLLFVGPRTADVIDRIAALGLDRRAYFADRVGRREMAAVYSAATVLLFPSLYEGFGYPVLEAQLCGTPVICSKAGSLPEVVGDGALSFAPGDIEGMASAISDLLDDPGRAAVLTELGRRNAERFRHEDWLKAHAAVYETLGLPDGDCAGRGARSLEART